VIRSFSVMVVILGLVFAPIPAHATKKKNKAKPVKSDIPAQPIVVPTQPGAVFRDCNDCPEMVVIPEGGFDMGSQGDVEKDERPEHRVDIARPFAMGRMEITRGQFAKFVKQTEYDAGDKCMMLVAGRWEEVSSINWRKPGFAQNDDHPVACISWMDAQAYVKWLSFETGQLYQLPTEAQWEYACRAGKRATYCGGEDLDKLGWYDKNSDRATHPAATKNSNAFGLYDMSGNVGEWVEDGYNGNYDGVPNDGSAWEGDVLKRVLRGGSWLSAKNNARSTFRSVSAPTYRYVDAGFRVFRELQ